jgi:hypothetical protein
MAPADRTRHRPQGKRADAQTSSGIFGANDFHDISTKYLRFGATMNTADKTCLAWNLADASAGSLGPSTRSAISAQIGARDPHSAIGATLAAIAAGVGLSPPPMAARAAAWLNCYRGNETEPALRRLLEQCTEPSARSVLCISDIDYGHW